MTDLDRVLIQRLVNEPYPSTKREGTFQTPTVGVGMLFPFNQGFQNPFSCFDGDIHFFVDRQTFILHFSELLVVVADLDLIGCQAYHLVLSIEQYLSSFRYYQ